MEPEARYTLVGTSVLILFALLAAAIVWLAASREGADVRSYKIYFTQQTLDGLEVRSNVKMKGIQVGSVTGFSFSSKRLGAVEVAINIDPQTPVLTSTRAVVERNMITGLAGINLLNLDESAARMAPPAPGEGVSVIAEGESKLQKFSETLDALAERADQTMRQIGAVLSTRNVAALSETLENFKLLSRNANGSLAKIDTTLASGTLAADSIRSATASLSGDVQRLAERYDTLGMEAISGVREITGSVKQLRDDISHLADRAESLLSNGNVELTLAGQQLRATADALGTTARKLGEPKAILFGPAPDSLGPGEVRQ